MSDDFEIKRALETYFREQYEMQTQIVDKLISMDKQQKALLAVFGAAANKMVGE